MMLGKINQGSDSGSSQRNFWGICKKTKMVSVFLALILASVSVQMVTGQSESRISFGHVPPPGKYPSLARIFSGNPDIPHHTYCVAAILNREWLVSAAHCFLDQKSPYPVETLGLVVGDEILNETEPYERQHKIERVIVHDRILAAEAYYNTAGGDDIAVFKVSPPIQFSNRVSPANLPTCSSELETGIGLVAGYGTREANSANWGKEDNHRLTEITNKIIPLDECSRRLKTKLDERIFCVEAINNMSTCFGDNGAPFYLVKNDHHMVQVGFLSNWPDQSKRCGFNKATISVFTRLSSYVGWIHRRISGCGNHPWWNESKG